MMTNRAKEKSNKNEQWRTGEGKKKKLEGETRRRNQRKNNDHE